MKVSIPLLSSLFIILLSSCTKKCSQWYEGTDCKELMTLKYTAHWAGTMTETNIVMADTTFSNHIDNTTIHFYKSTSATPPNHLSLGFPYHCYHGLTNGCVYNPNTTSVEMEFTSENEFNVLDYNDNTKKIGSGSISLSGSSITITFSITSSSSMLAVQSGTYSFTGTKQ